MFFDKCVACESKCALYVTYEQLITLVAVAFFILMSRHKSLSVMRMKTVLIVATWWYSISVSWFMYKSPCHRRCSHTPVALQCLFQSGERPRPCSDIFVRLIGP